MRSRAPVSKLHNLHNSLFKPPKTLVFDFVLQQPYYYRSLPSGCPQYLRNRLQKVQHNVARLVLKAPRLDSISPHLRNLHWLPVDARIKYTISLFYFAATTSTGHVYLSDLLKICIPSCQFQSSADTRMPYIPFVNTKSYDERSFSYIAPTMSQSASS